MLIGWWRSRTLRRERARVTDADWDWVWDSLPLLAGLDESQWHRLTDLALRFLRDKRLEPAGGLVVTDRMGLLIAVQACLPILELGLDWYRGWYAVIVYPEPFVPAREYADENGLVWVDDQAKSGEAWEQGPVILSWSDVAAGLEPDGYNVVIHEMAHKLDMRDGAANGCPPLHPQMSAMDWKRDLTAAYDDLCRRDAAAEDTPIDPYATESPAELFAVVSEAFFEIPDVLAQAYPAVYAQLRAFYRQDPLARLASIDDSRRDVD